mmetsp:Transcript_36646/g.76896  ORF Transcript_36646/g.76896 Transcript_36646/m.76896 type:complete len:445 (-) Transcript_36646:81-1415(-)
MTKMPKTGKGKSSKAKKNDVLSKPKRPMSAYNFFFRAERAKIISESSLKGSDADATGKLGTSFEEIGRTIGKRWRAIKWEEHSKYKDLAIRDSARYEDEMKAFYEDELNSMCLRQECNKSKSNADSDPKKIDGSHIGYQLPNDEASSWNPPASLKETISLANFDQVRHGTTPQWNGNRPGIELCQHHTNSQTKSMMFANERASAGMINPSYSTYCQNMPIHMPLDPMSMRYMPSVEPKDSSTKKYPGEDFRMLLQHHKLSSSPFQNEAIMKLVLNQKALIEHRQKKVHEEINELQIKNKLLSRMLAQEASILPSKSTNTLIPDPSHNPLGSLDMDRTTNDSLRQFLQKQKVSMGGNDAAIVLGNHVSMDGWSSMFGPPAPALGPLMHKLLQRNSKQSMSNFIPTIPVSRTNVPINEANAMGFQGSSTSMRAEENLFLENFKKDM